MAMKLPPSTNWLRNEGASSSALQLLVDSVEVELPKEYLELLAFSNGGEGRLVAPYYTLCLDNAATASEPERIALFKNIYPGWFVFGGDGGGQLYAFDFTGEQPWPVVSFDGIDPEGSVEKVANSFITFLQLLAVKIPRANGPEENRRHGLDLNITVTATVCSRQWCWLLQMLSQTPGFGP